jgi:hypothetical protein
MIYQQAIASATQSIRSENPWDTFSESMHESLDRLEEILDDISDLSEVCQGEWCDAANCMLGEATVAVFAVSEPHWMPEEESKRLKELKKRVYDQHASRRPSVH